MSNGPKILDFDGFCDGQSVFEFHAQVSDSAVHFCMSEQQLYSAQVASLFVDLRHFVLRIECVPYALASRPIDVTQSRTIRAYWRVEI